MRKTTVKCALKTVFGILGLGIAMVGAGILIWAIIAENISSEQKYIETAQASVVEEKSPKDALALEPLTDTAIIRFVPLLPSKRIFLQIVNEVGEDILVVDQEGIVYKGERVKDKGEAYQAVIDAMQIVITEREEEQ